MGTLPIFFEVGPLTLHKFKGMVEYYICWAFIVPATGYLVITFRDKWFDYDTLEEKMESLAKLFSARQIPFEVDTSGNLPVLTALACPYPELAESDHSICSMERLLFSELLGETVRLGKCRLDGDQCCTFNPREDRSTHSHQDCSGEPNEDSVCNPLPNDTIRSEGTS